jgi:hypothetical protein
MVIRLADEICVCVIDYHHAFPCYSGRILA